MSLDAIRAKAKPSQTSITLFLDGEIDTELRRLVADLQALEATDSLGGDPERTRIEDAIEACGERGEASKQVFVLRTVDANRWDIIQREHPARDEREQVNLETFPPAILAECLVGPKLTAGEVRELKSLITSGQWEELWGTCYLLNKGMNSSIPKSARRSDATQNSVETPTTAARAESLEASSLDES